MCHLCRVNFLKPLYQCSETKTKCDVEMKSYLLCSIFNLQSCSPDCFKHFRGIIELVCINVYPWKNYHPTVLVIILIQCTIFFRACVNIAAESGAPTIDTVL